MQKQKPNKEVLLQSIYDYGIDGTCKRWNISEDNINKILYPESRPAPKIRQYGDDEIKIDDKVSAIIEKNYNQLKSKYVNDLSKMSMCQTSDDIFHNTLLKVMADLSLMDEQQILDYIDFKFKMINFQIKQDQKDLHKHQIYMDNANN